MLFVSHFCLEILQTAKHAPQRYKSLCFVRRHEYCHTEICLEKLNHIATAHSKTYRPTVLQSSGIWCRAVGRASRFEQTYCLYLQGEASDTYKKHCVLTTPLWKPQNCSIQVLYSKSAQHKGVRQTDEAVLHFVTTLNHLLLSHVYLYGTGARICPLSAT